MKYIKTKNGRILFVSEKITDIYGTYYLYDNDTKWFENEIIKVADTIYELCDYVIIKYPYEKLPHIINLEKMNKKGKLHNPPAKYIDNLIFLMADKRAEYIIFATWNGKELVNVAEMNENGEIESL